MTDTSTTDIYIHTLYEQCIASGNTSICHLCTPPTFHVDMDAGLEHMKTTHNYGNRQEQV